MIAKPELHRSRWLVLAERIALMTNWRQRDMALEELDPHDRRAVSHHLIKALGERIALNEATSVGRDAAIAAAPEWIRKDLGDWVANLMRLRRKRAFVDAFKR